MSTHCANHVLDQQLRVETTVSEPEHEISQHVRYNLPFFFFYQVGRPYKFSPIIFKSQHALDAEKSINRKTGYRAGEQNGYCPIKVIKRTSWPESLDMMEQ
jgi:hypothetical protein